VHGPSGTLVQTLTPTRARGINRVIWNLRHADLPVRGGSGEDDEGPQGGNLAGPYVAPGMYTVRLVAGGATLEQNVEVKDDPRIDAPPEDRKLWADLQMQLADIIRQFAPVADKVQKAPAGDAQMTELKRQSRELLSRLTRLYGGTGRWVGRPTANQQSSLRFYQEMVTKLTAAASGI
jgi:hypothetical protein